MTTPLLKREQIPAEATWNKESVFADQHTWELEFTQLDSRLPEFKDYVGQLGASARTLATVLNLREEIGVALGKVGVYAGMQAATDAENQEYAAMSSRVRGQYARFGAATAFIEPELLELAPETLKAYTAQEEGLRDYSHYFAQLDLRRGHVRTAEIEALLAQVGEPLGTAGNVFGALTDADMTFKAIVSADGQTVEVAQGTMGNLTRNPERATRQAAWESYADGYLGVKNTLAATLSGSIKTTVFYARAHGYSSALDAALSPYNIPRTVFDNLLETCEANLPIWHRYFGILKRGLKADTLNTFDAPIYEEPAPLIQNGPTIPFTEGGAMIERGLAPLGPEYLEPMRRGLASERWVDRLPNQGKGPGAFSWGSYGTHPFIMMNYHNSIFSVSTLAHELGHSLHSYFTWQSQKPVYSSYSMFVAETASNFNQAMVRAHLLKENDDRTFQISVLEEAISNFHRYLFVMPTLARFELDCHERIERGEALTAESMSVKIVSLFREGYGPEMTIDEPRLGITWAMFGHLYASFYVFQYATGISAANALAEDVLTGGPEAAARYLDFLKAGDALFPLDALKVAGIDMTSPEPIQRAFGVLSRLIDRLDTLV